MTRSTSIPTRVRALARATLLVSIALAQPLRAQGAAAPTQIDWQRDLEDALALAQAQQRPLLVAVNMDGESASERIVRERYRDPAFVTLTRPFVCVVASAFRHAPRDHDEQGRRIACPRLGQVTCGEHIALEPLLFERYLQGERIAPRHALVRVDSEKVNGEKSFDLFQLFDLRDLDRALAGADTPPPEPAIRRAPTVEGAAYEAWNLQRLARARDHRSRLACEQQLLAITARAEAERALSAVAQARNPNPVEALGCLLTIGAQTQAPQASWGADWFERVARTALELDAAPGLAAAVRARLMAAGPCPGSMDHADVRALFPVLGMLDGSAPASRSLLLAIAATGNAEDREAARAALLAGGAAPVITDAELGFDLEAKLVRLGEIPARALPLNVAAEPAPGVEALESELEDADRALSRAQSDAQAMARFGRAALALARQRIDAQMAGGDLFLQDALVWLERAQAERADDVTLALDLARTNWLLGRFAEQERWGLAAWRLAVEAATPNGPASRAGAADTPGNHSGANDPSAASDVGPKRAPLNPRLEACRWLGDASARLLEARSGGDPLVEARGIARGARAFARALAEPEANDSDWLSLASVCGALGLRRAELACLQTGAARFYESNALRQALNTALWNVGRTDLAPIKAAWIADQHRRSAPCAWYTGYAHLLAAEDLRRAEAPERALESYRACERAFTRSVELDPGVADSAHHYKALAALGRGFAHLLAERQGEAAQELVEAIVLRPAIATARDGLEREAIDLLDAVLEERARGPSPVDPLALLTALEGADPGNTSWARAIADSELREALRADGRADVAGGDKYMEHSIAAARRAFALGGNAETPGGNAETPGGDAETPGGDAETIGVEARPEIEPNRRALAQSLAVHGERLNQRGEVERARPLVLEAARLCGVTIREGSASWGALKVISADLRTILGEARPVFRPGR